MLKAVKIRLYPTKIQQDYINQLLGCYRLVYNKCLDKKKTTYLNGKIAWLITNGILFLSFRSFRYILAE